MGKQYRDGKKKVKHILLPKKEYGVCLYQLGNPIVIGKWDDIFKPVYIYGKKSKYVVDIVGNVYNKKKQEKI